MIAFSFGRSVRIFRLVGWVILPLALAVGCARTPKLRDRRVLVMNFENTITDKEAKPYSKSLAEMMTACLANSPRVVVIERQDLRHLLENAENSPTRWQKLGRQAGVDYLVVGSISRLDQNYIVNARLLSVDTGEIVRNTSISRYCKREEDLYPVIQAISRVLAYQLEVLAKRYDAYALNGSLPATSSTASSAPAPAPAPAPLTPAPPAAADAPTVPNLR